MPAAHIKKLSPWVRWTGDLCLFLPDFLGFFPHVTKEKKRREDLPSIRQRDDVYMQDFFFRKMPSVLFVLLIVCASGFAYPSTVTQFPTSAVFHANPVASRSFIVREGGRERHWVFFHHNTGTSQHIRYKWSDDGLHWKSDPSPFVIPAGPSFAVTVGDHHGGKWVFLIASGNTNNVVSNDDNVLWRARLRSFHEPGNEKKPLADAQINYEDFPGGMVQQHSVVLVGSRLWYAWHDGGSVNVQARDLVVNMMTNIGGGLSAPNPVTVQTFSASCAEQLQFTAFPGQDLFLSYRDSCGPWYLALHRYASSSWFTEDTFPLTATSPPRLHASGYKPPSGDFQLHFFVTSSVSATTDLAEVVFVDSSISAPDWEEEPVTWVSGLPSAPTGLAALVDPGTGRRTLAWSMQSGAQTLSAWSCPWSAASPSAACTHFSLSSDWASAGTADEVSAISLGRPNIGPGPPGISWLAEYNDPQEGMQRRLRYALLQPDTQAPPPPVGQVRIEYMASQQFLTGNFGDGSQGGGMKFYLVNPLGGEIYLGFRRLGDDGSFSFLMTTALNNGEHIIRVETLDSIGNVSESSYLHFHVDTMAPAAPVILKPAKNALVDYASLEIEGSAEAFSRVRIYEGSSGPPHGNALREVLADESGKFRITSIPKLGLGSRVIRAFAQDAAGNISLASASRSFTIQSYCPRVQGLECNGRGSCGQVGNSGEYACACNPGFFGDRCQFVANPCIVQSTDGRASQEEWKGYPAWFISKIPKNEDPFFFAGNTWSRSVKKASEASSNPSEWTRLASARWCLGYENNVQTLFLGYGSSRLPNSYRALADSKTYRFGSGPRADIISPQSKIFRAVWKIGVPGSGKVIYLSSLEHIPGEDNENMQAQNIIEIFEESQKAAPLDEKTFAGFVLDDRDNFLWGQGRQPLTTGGTEAQELFLLERGVEFLPLLQTLGINSLNETLLVQLQTYSVTSSANGRRRTETLRDSSSVVQQQRFGSSPLLTAPALRHVKKRGLFRCKASAQEKRKQGIFQFERAAISPGGEQKFRIIRKKSGIWKTRLRKSESISCSILYDEGWTPSVRVTKE